MQPSATRDLIVGLFVALGLASPAWAQGTPVATIGDHTFYRVSRL